jgi:hypothetical protein
MACIISHRPGAARATDECIALCARRGSLTSCAAELDQRLIRTIAFGAPGANSSRTCRGSQCDSHLFSTQRQMSEWCAVGSRVTHIIRNWRQRLLSPCPPLMVLAVDSLANNGRVRCCWHARDLLRWRQDGQHLHKRPELCRPPQRPLPHTPSQLIRCHSVQSAI